MHSSEYERIAGEFGGIQPSNIPAHGEELGQRRHQRVPWSTQVNMKELSSDSDFPTLAVPGTVVNISAGGMCVHSDVPLLPGTTVVCEMALPGINVPFPTLMQVVWVDGVENERYAWGLRYVV